MRRSRPERWSGRAAKRRKCQRQWLHERDPVETLKRSFQKSAPAEQESGVPTTVRVSRIFPFFTSNKICYSTATDSLTTAGETAERRSLSSHRRRPISESRTRAERGIC